jgi:hypothetical protein
MEEEECGRSILHVLEDAHQVYFLFVTVDHKVLVPIGW